MRKSLAVAVALISTMSFTVGSAQAAWTPDTRGQATNLIRQLSNCAPAGTGANSCVAILQALVALEVAAVGRAGALTFQASNLVTQRFQSAGIAIPSVVTQLQLDSAATAGNTAGGGCNITAASASDSCFA